MNKTQDKIKWLFGDTNLKQDISKDKNKNKMIKRKETRFEKLENRIKAIGGFLMKQNHSGGYKYELSDTNPTSSTFLCKTLNDVENYIVQFEAGATSEMVWR